MFTLDFLKKIKEDDYFSIKVRDQIRNQLYVLSQEDIIQNNTSINEAIEDIDKTISFLEYAESENRKEEKFQNIEVLKEEISILIKFLEKL